MPTIPLAVQTYNFQNFYLVQRDSPGVWSTVSTLYDAGLNRTTLSLGALTSVSSSQWGIVVQNRANEEILFLGPGLPTASQQIAAPGNNYTAPGFWDGSWGAWFFGGAWWVALIDRINHFDQFTVLRSVTGATGTWVAVDVANQPTSAITSGSQWAVRLDKTTGIVRVFGNSGTRNEFSLWTMDMNANGGLGAWSASFGFVDMTRHIFVSSSNAPTEAGSNGIVSFANGDIGVFYCDDLSDSGNTFYRFFNGTVWSAEIIVALCDGASRTAFANVYLDADTPDLLHVFHYVDTHAGLSPMRSGPVYDKVTHTGTVTAAIFTFPVSVNGSDGVGGGGIFDGNIYAPFDDQTATNPPTNNQFLPNSIWVAPVSTGIFVKESLPYPIADDGQPPSCAFMSFELTITPPTPTVVQQPEGGRGFIRFTLTAFDGCLGREYRWYEQIDRTLLSCGVKPACFCIDERDWGTTNDDDEIIPGAPSGSVAFNPSGQIVLPTTVSGDNVILQFTVPVGYDGIILGQFHGYYKTPFAGILPPSFIEGSGDIVWRLSANGRFLRDCGNMLFSLGTIRSQSPVAGGLQLRSQDIVKYLVNVPNLSGNLAPGQGSIVAGLHGYFWPRK